MTAYHYEGDELTLFREANQWKDYLRARIRPHIHGRVLEVGAGLGGSTRVLRDPADDTWVCLEPDAALAARLRDEVATMPSPERVAVCEGTLLDLDDRRFDTILYVDVLEHIADDRSELARAASRLAPDGSLVVLSPAHPWLYSPFDRAIGHHRRYTLPMLRALSPPGARLAVGEYLDAVGLLASLGNRLLLRHAMPTPAQVALWDRAMVPLSRRLDGLLGYRVGKSVLAVWRRG